MIKELKNQGCVFCDTDNDLDFIDSDIIEFTDSECSLVVSEHDGCWILFKGGVRPKPISVDCISNLIIILNALGIIHELKVN